MAFPATYNFSYYRGDTYELIVTPKDDAGNAFPLEGYFATFAIGAARGTGDYVEGEAEINNSTIRCAITPETLLPSGSNLVYDIEIANYLADPYPKVFTLLTGNIAITEQVGSETSS